MPVLTRSELLPIASALVAAAAFTLVRNEYDLEDSRFLVGLAAASASAAVVAGAAARSLTRGAFAATLVPVLFATGIAARLALCLVGIGECYGN